jgi:hypothetical protein
MTVRQASDDGQASGPPENPNRRSKLPLFSRIASRATRALNAAEWLRLGFFMDLFPPVTSVPSQKSTGARVRKTGATSERRLATGWRKAGEFPPSRWGRSGTFARPRAAAGLRSIASRRRQARSKDAKRSRRWRTR